MYRYLTLEDTWLENKHMKRCSRSNVIKKVQIKATRYHGTPISEWPKSGTLIMPILMRRVRNRNSHLLLLRMKWYNHSRRQFVCILQN